MIDLWIHPGVLFFIAAGLLPFVKPQWKSHFKLTVPVLGFLCLLIVSHGNHGVLSLLGQQEMIFGRVDKLSLVFGYVITIATLIGMVFSLHVKGDQEHMAGLVYAGSALGTVFAGDFLTIFLFWEAMAFSSALLIFYAPWKNGEAVGMRYLYVHIFGGLLLLAGIFIHVGSTGEIAFDALPKEGVGPMLILAGFLLNAAVPPLSAWLPDAYPESTITGVVFMSALTTKTAVYVLLRGFAGTELLVPLGVFMALYGVVYAVIENDIRRLLAYHIISQVGYMVAGAGMGSEMAVNGATSHAFAHILYKGLLMMGMSAVIMMTGKRKLTELGGLYKYMPWTFMLYMVGGFAISGFPFFSGFVSKSMVISAAAELHRPWVAMLLTLASAGTFLHTGLKLPYYVFFWRDWDQKTVQAQEIPKDPPKNMLWGMGLAAFACIFIGIVPGALYQALPFDAEYHPYTWSHLVQAYQILLMTGVGFFMLLKHLDPKETISLDTDWIYRKGAAYFQGFSNPFKRFKVYPYQEVLNGLTRIARTVSQRFQSGYLKHYLIMIVSFVMFSTLLFSLFKGWALNRNSLLQTEITLAQLLIFVLIIFGTLATVLFKNRISAILSLGMTGFFVAFFYVLMGAPDLALTQYLVEAVSVILILLVFYFLPSYFEEKATQKTKTLNIAVSLLVGVVMTYYMLMVMDSHLTESISGYYLEMSEKLAGGRNVVNVVIVDFRGFDTLLEISVFAIAALGIYGMLKLNKKKRPVRDQTVREETK